MCTMIDLCFMCSNNNKCNIVDDKILTQVEYLMPEITIIKLRLQLRFCSICEQNLQMFSTFKKNCVENSLRLEAQIKEAQDNTDVIDNCPTSETTINRTEEVYIKEEVLEDSDNLEVKYSLVKEIAIKQDPLPENHCDRELGGLQQEILKEESPPQANTYLHEYSGVGMDDSEINSHENILITDNGSHKIYTCLICMKMYNNLSYLKIHHMKIHTGKRDFQCDECKKWFSHKSHLTRHMKQHTGVKDFQCSECKKCFARKSYLITHMKHHSGVKDFQCNECKKWFSDKPNLIAHMKQHTGVKDFQCSECKKWFLRKHHLTSHMKQHTGVKDFQCNKCKKCFSHKSNLSRHMKQHNEENDEVN